MKKMKLWMLAALLTIGGASVFTACKDGDEGGGTKENRKAKKALLIILDGWGIGDKGQGDVIAQTATPYMDYLKTNYPNAELHGLVLRHLLRPCACAHCRQAKEQGANKSVSFHSSL